MFNEQTLRQALSDTPLSFFFFPTVDSTNSEARRYAIDGNAVPALFLAEEQTAGRGRMGRSFFSPHSTGIYLSLLLKTNDALSDPITATTASAVAVRQAIEAITGISVGIKWVNDLYYDGKKICGILAESFFVGADRYLIVGVGVNLSTVDFPEELQGTAGSLFAESTTLREALAAEIARRLYSILTDGESNVFMEDYRAASLVLGQDITYLQNGVARCGVAEAVDELGRLLVRHSDGTTELLASGEISLRINDKKGEPK
ncbi:MAG: biotin--[acetyl-CoA-carboxylase] ligase [Clostridia bacterium]|nr:biotin--[acetyl-CoA-carboxylase] ligase [Clostridia bacterium]